MTTPQEPRRDQRARAVAAAIVALLAAILTVAGTPGPASAAAPRVAQRWASLMYHSLTPTPAYVQLRKTLATQRATLATRAQQLSTGRDAHGTAQAGLATAVTADAAARTRSAVAREALTSARNTLTVVSQQRPRNGIAVTGARNTITAAAQTVTTRRTQAREAATALKTAQAASRTATINLDKATIAWETAAATVRTNQRKLIALDHSAELAAQAAAISRDVVTEIRPAFVVADSTTVYGVTVHKKVAFAFRRMLDAAKADGIILSGGGFRTKQRQIQLRTINGCPDVWTAPASSCRVPTAIPGRSLHEIGLAIDITSGGTSLTANSAAFRWMAANAGRYGFVNLPSEPWHWSITGG
ncbi:D-alanyl-D-alanine carboxypeptidase [Actinoplanes sp. ATCC 53533]|uniref:M15 family metallopeptidase n=1 Tax=Actinoplanes sp. ATCC 53533 TaxID=1288362 RepID=UPI000F7B6AEB|nr:M15 family metallopeptidase [Actinoplanes sp. ATCC 53533]RSM58317.1 D-alanyl-D-alanine carboxypeptidase [Actinoplanes sp. ATCC 53533]